MNPPIDIQNEINNIFKNFDSLRFVVFSSMASYNNNNNNNNNTNTIVFDSSYALAPADG